MVAGLAHGELVLDEEDPLGTVQYIIFEEADGDVRQYLSDSDFDSAWNFRALHHIATGIGQVHKLGSVHQDVKPSNVLVFAGATSKITDFGCASTKGGGSPRGHIQIAGDPQYAPPELRYGHVPDDWGSRRVGCDLYHLGSMAVFLFSDVSMNGLLFDEVPDEYLPGRWFGDYFEVLPYLQNAFSSALELFSVDVPSDYRQELLDLVEQLCNPDPRKRGWRRNFRRGRNQYTVEPFVGRFDLLAAKAERGLFPRHR